MRDYNEHYARHEQKKFRFEYVPGWLAKRFPAIADLEDNPVYLRESGLKYHGKKQNLWDRFFHGIKGLAISVVAFIIFLAIFIFLFLLLNCCAIIIVFPTALFIQSYLSRLIKADRLTAVSQLSLHVEQEWQKTTLQALYLTNLSGKEIVWGYTGKFLIKSINSSIYILILLFVLGLVYPLIYLLLQMDLTFIHPFQDLLVMDFFSKPLEVTFCSFTAIFVFWFHALLGQIHYFYSSVMDQITYIGYSDSEKGQKGCSHYFIGVFQSMAMLIPGIVAGTIATLIYSVSFGDYLIGFSDTLPFLVGYAIFFLVYALVNLLITNAMIKEKIKFFMEFSGAYFIGGIDRLREREVGQVQSRIFGE